MTALKNLLYSSIKSNQEIFDFIQNFALNGFWLINPENLKEIYFNPKLKGILETELGLKLDDSSNSSKKFLPKKELKKVITAVNKNFKNISTPVDLEITYPEQSDTEIHFNCKAIAIVNLKEDINTILVAHNYYTNRNKDLDDTNKNKERIVQIIEDTNIGTWEWNLQTEELIFNEKWANLLGYNLYEIEPITTNTWANFVHPDDLKNAATLMEDYIQGKTDFYEVESRFKHKFGKWIWIKDSGKVVSWTADGKPEWMAGSHQDITDKKELQLLLENYQDLLERSNEAARIGTWEVDLHKNELFWSKVTKQIHEVHDNYSPKLTEAINFYPSGTSRNIIEKSIKGAINKGENYDIEVEISTQSGQRKWIRTIGISDFENGECKRLYGLFQDIHNRKESERLNTERQTLLETILKSIDVGIVSCDREGNLTLFNKATKEWHGLPLTDIPPSQFSKYYGLFKPDGITPLKTEEIPLLKILNNGSLINEEIVIKPNNSKKRNVSVTGVQLKDEKGEVNGAVVAMHDITFFKESENQKILNDAIFRSNFENSGIGMIVLNTKGDWLNYNHHFLEQLNYNDNDFTNKKFINLLHPDITEKYKKIFKEVSLTQTEYYYDEIKLKHKNGNYLNIILSGSLIRNINNKPEYFIFQLIDVTPQKLAEKKLKDTLTNFKSIIEASTSTMMVGTDTNGIITFYNSGAERMLGYKRDEVVGSKNPGLFHIQEEMAKVSEDLTAEYGTPIVGFDVFKKLVETQKSNREWTLKRKDGTTFPAQLNITAIQRDDEIIGLLGIGTDISVLKTIQKEITSVLEISMSQNERLKNFADIVSHNLRSHSGNIGMLLDLIREEYPAIQDGELFTHLFSASDNLKETISHLNEIVLINASKENKMEKLKLSKYINKAVENLSASAKDQNVCILNEVPENIRILAVPAYLDSILMNFLSNGIKYSSPRRKSFVTLNTEQTSEYVILTIADNGLGIDLKKHRAKIFGMYKTFHKNNDSRGIGLYITKNQIESLGGKIELESEVDKGTTFKIYFKYEEI